MELYGERGFDQTTVAEIAERAGLSERTFFRHFADKREVLFWGASALQERELIKLASLAAAPADTLRGRGVGEPAASLSAEAGIAVFKIAFERWIADAEQRDLRQLMRESLHELRAVTAGGAGTLVTTT
jgi:AcrR family transcriptional regulator